MRRENIVEYGAADSGAANSRTKLEYGLDHLEDDSRAVLGLSITERHVPAPDEDHGAARPPGIAVYP